MIARPLIPAPDTMGTEAGNGVDIHLLLHRLELRQSWSIN